MARAAIVQDTRSEGRGFPQNGHRKSYHGPWCWLVAAYDPKQAFELSLPMHQLVRIYYAGVRITC